MLESFWAMALELSFKGTVVLMAAWAAILVARRASAALRHLIWVLALGGLLVLPEIGMFLPAWRTPVPARATVSISEVRTIAATGGTTPRQHAAPSTSPERLGLAALAIWMAGVVVCLYRWRNGIGQAARLRRQSLPITDDHVSRVARELAGLLGLRRPVDVLIAATDIMPMATGVRRPAILLPANASRWSQERQRVVLLHEMAHIQRNDCLTQALAELVFCLYWFHPLVWVAMRGLRVERERACDDLVLCAGNRASDYAAHLLDLARSLEPPELAASAITMASSSHLETRLRAILNPHRNRRALTHVSGAAACLIAACLVIPLAAMRPQTDRSRTVSGAVYDPEGAVVPEAQVILTDVNNGQKQTTATDPAGQFSIGPLADGAYRLEVNARGFKPAIRRLKVDGTNDLRVDILLDLGSVQETLTVRGKQSAAAAPAMPAQPHRVRVGGNVVPAKLVEQAKPEYPEDAKSRGIEGDVVLRAVIRMDGTVGGLGSIASPDPSLTKAAMNAVRQWRYEPSLLNGKPMETVTTITVNFQLEP